MTVFCGIDVNATTLAVAVIEADQPVQQRQFLNRSTGHKALIGWLGNGNRRRKRPCAAARQDAS
jgi:cell division protein FtsX